MYYNISPVIFPDNIKPLITRLIEHTIFIERMIGQLGFKKEMKEFYDNHPLVEEIEMPNGFFEAFDDENIKLVIGLLQNANVVIDSLLNLNNVKLEELEFKGITGLRFGEEME